ncbi:DUF5723 family protein [Bacteroidota bacterium]
MIELRQLKILVVLFFVLLSMSSNGQNNNTLFLMHSVPQSNYINPAVNPRCKIFIGIPFLNTMDINYSNTSFTLSELTADDQIQLYPVYDRLPGINIIGAKFMTYPLSFGYSYKTNYFTFAIADRVSTYFSFTKDLIGLVLHGNYQYIGDPAHFHPRFDATYFREYSVGWAFDWDEYNAVGIKGKMLFGKGNIGTGKSDIIFSTEPQTFGLSLAGDLSLNASFPLELELSDNNIPAGVQVNTIDPVSFLLNRRNMGIGFDLGYINTWFEDFTFSASVLDLGAILWRDNLNNVNASSDALFEGVQADLSFFFDSDFEEVFRNFRDSLLNQFSYEFAQNSYFTFLPTQVYLGAEYHVLDQVDIGLVVRNAFESRTLKTSATAALKLHIIKGFHGSLSWSYINRSFKNFGAGLAYSGKGFQWYAVTDNFYGYIRPVDARSLSLRFGMNLMFGCYDIKELRRTKGHGMLPCPVYEKPRQNKTQASVKKKGKRTMVPSIRPEKSEKTKFKLQKK